jgi:carbamoyl-phosphate synthase large subunit
MKVLITSASRKVSLVQAFKKALKEEGGGQVLAMDASKNSAALYFADSFYQSPLGLDNEFLQYIHMVCIQNHVDIIIPTRDAELPFFARHKELFTNSEIEVMIPSIEIVNICQNKKEFIDFCKLQDLHIPITYNTSAVQFPVFVRPSRGSGSSSVYKANNWEDMDYVLDKIDDPLIQEYVDAKEYTIDLFSDFDSNIISVLPRERVSIFGGESFVGRTIYNEQIILESIRLASKLGLVGHNTIQCFYRLGQVLFIEVNPRYGGGANLGFRAGHFTPRYLVKILKGDKLAPQIGEFESGLKMLRYTQDYFFYES